MVKQLNPQSLVEIDRHSNTIYKYVRTASCLLSLETMECYSAKIGTYLFEWSQLEVLRFIWRGRYKKMFFTCRTVPQRALFSP